MFIFDNTTKNHDAKMYDICFECELDPFEYYKQNLHFIPLRRSEDHERHFTALR